MRFIFFFKKSYTKIPPVIRWLLLTAILLKIFSFFPSEIESWYSISAYPLLASFFRLLTGWLPFSLGDLIYLTFLTYLFWSVYRILSQGFIAGFKFGFWKIQLKKILSWSLFIYVSFNLFWGLNYDRKGVQSQFNLKDTTVDPASLIRTIELSHQNLNVTYPKAFLERRNLKKSDFIFKEAVSCYQTIQKKSTFLSYTFPSVKPSLFGKLGNYMGYSGYYNPFSGEAHVNTTVPDFILPYTTCHEIAHQIGYAKEQEANFIGFLAAKSSPNPTFRYAVYFELYLYARPYLYRQDSLKLKQLDSTLLPGVRKDITELKTFYQSYKTPVENWVDQFYEQYLKANEQPEGQLAYGKIMIWLVEYVRRYGSSGL